MLHAVNHICDASSMTQLINFQVVACPWLVYTRQSSTERAVFNSTIICGCLLRNGQLSLWGSRQFFAYAFSTCYICIKKGKVKIHVCQVPSNFSSLPYLAPFKCIHKVHHKVYSQSCIPEHLSSAQLQASLYFYTIETCHLVTSSDFANKIILVLLFSVLRFLIRVSSNAVLMCVCFSRSVSFGSGLGLSAPRSVAQCCTVFLYQSCTAIVL